MSGIGSNPQVSKGMLRTKVEYSIIVVNYNGGALLIECLGSVYRFKNRDFELILVDNNSSDGSEVTAAKLFPGLKLVKNEKNVGFAKANNVALEMAVGRWVVLLNPDTIVTPGWLDTLVRCAESGDHVGIVTPKLLRKDKVTIDSTGHLLEFETGRTADRGSGEPDRGQYDRVQEVPSCCFACAVIRKEVFEDIGPLDDKMILYFEDVDFSLRARIAGWKIIYCPRTSVYHVRAGVTPSLHKITQKRAVAYRLRIMLKCYDSSNVLKYATVRVLKDFISAAAGIKNNDLSYSLGYFRSPIWNLLNLPIKERIFIQSRRRVADAEIAQNILGGIRSAIPK